MTIGIQANILAIHDKLMDLLAKKATGDVVVGTNLVLQGAGPNSLGWNDRELDDFLEREVQAKFGVLIQRRHLRSTVNGTTPTLGDLSIAISAAIHRQYRPRRNPSVL